MQQSMNQGVGGIRSSPTPPLFASIHRPGGVYNEAFDEKGNLRQAWHSLAATFESFSLEQLAAKKRRLQRMWHEDGATFNPFEDLSSKGTAWSLDLLPLPIGADEWALLEEGLRQRAQVLERVLADVYGDQRLVTDGILPAEILFANPNFLRPCHGVLPVGGRHLLVYSADVYRDETGRFRVWRDCGGNPFGLGYALENRIVISRILSELYQQSRVCRLAPFFQEMQRNLYRGGTFRQSEPEIVLLSPGPEHPCYFEQALLSRYLGYPLVESEDLTVRNGKIFMKKLAGLENVEVIVRFLEDATCDPFALRRGNARGVAGLLQVARERQVHLVNPVGSGFIDTPVLSAFLPGLCRYFLKRDILLGGHPRWWCGSRDGESGGEKEELVVSSAMDRRWSVPLERSASHGEHAWAYMLSEPLRPSHTPVLTAAGPTSHPVLMRVFAMATDEGFTVLPGGLAITSPDVATLAGEHRQQQQSKDIWVISEQPVTPFSMLDSLETVSSFRRGSDLPSRVADNLLWLGRYLERAEDLIRLLRAVYRRLSGEARPQDLPEFLFLLDLLRAQNTLPPLPASQKESPLALGRLAVQLHDALFRHDLSGSVAKTLVQVMGAARNVRDRLSLDCWRALNRLEHFNEGQSGDPLDHLDETLFVLSSFSGLALEGMTRGLGWRFMDMGRRLERAMNQIKLLRMGLPAICGSPRSGLEALLEVADSLMTYRGRYRTVVQVAPVLDLLLLDESNPKSLAFQLCRLADHVSELPRQDERRYGSTEERLALSMLTEVRLLELAGLDCREGELVQRNLLASLDSVGDRLQKFADQVTAHYLSRVTSTSHFSSFGGR